MIPITNAAKFKGEIEKYLKNGQNHLDSSRIPGTPSLSYFL